MRRPKKVAAPPQDLRSRIVAASIGLIEEDGLAGLSMREVARRAGVTHQAPYHHFQDREAILAAVVAEGFEDLTGRLQQALDASVGGDRGHAMLAMGQAYVRFALDRPGVFRIMFRRELVEHERFPEVAVAGERAFSALLRLVDRVGGVGSTEVRASLQWSLVHGLATLLIDGKLGELAPDRSARLAHADLVMQRFADLFATATDPP